MDEQGKERETKQNQDFRFSRGRPSPSTHGWHLRKLVRNPLTMFDCVADCSGVSKPQSVPGPKDRPRAGSNRDALQRHAAADWPGSCRYETLAQNTYPIPRTERISGGRPGSKSIFLRRRATRVSIERSK